LVQGEVTGWVEASGAYRPLVLSAALLVSLGFLFLLVTVTAWPWLHFAPISSSRVAVRVREERPPVFPSRTYSTILVPLDHSDADREALGNAVALAKMHDAKIILLHVEEGVTSQLFGALSSTAEINEGQDYLATCEQSLREQGIRAEIVVRHGKSPAREIASAASELQPDLVVMSSHGHRGLKDLIFGTTINAVRHRVSVPLLIVRAQDSHV
ncbi:MAG: universal stress protein, partial [Bryobacteraceae bacterium]